MNRWLLALLMAVSVLPSRVSFAVPAAPDRVEAVAERGAKVMPFALDRTQHFFDKTDTGGIQKVLAKSPADGEQVRLIREHLADLAARFTHGDFSGPARIHGGSMPGLAEMDTGAEHIAFVYRDLPEGGQIDYKTDRAALVTAIHRFFDAQLNEHGRHATTTSHQAHHP